MSSTNKGAKMQLTQVIELLNQGNLKALAEIPAEVIQQAMATTGTTNRAATLGVKVYDKSGSIGITGIRRSPIVLYAGEWRIVAKVMESEAFAKALTDPAASTGSTDPRFAKFREASKLARQADTEARKAAE